MKGKVGVRMIILLAVFAVGLLAGGLLIGLGQAESPVPKAINYQGLITDKNTGEPLAGTFDITFKLWNCADCNDGANMLWEETQTNVSLSNGLFNVRLGNVTELNASVFDGSPRYLGVTIEGDSEMSPRLLMETVPYAYHAEEAEHADTADSVKQVIQDFVVASGESVTAGDVVSFLDRFVQKGIPPANIAYGSEYAFNPASTGFISAAALSDSKFVVAYTDYGNSSCGAAVIGDVSGTTISYGSEYVFNPAGTIYSFPAALSDTKFVIIYNDVGNSNRGTAVIGDVSGSTITYGAEYVFNNPGGESDISAAALSDTKFVVTYEDDGNFKYGTAVIGNVSGNTITYGAEYLFKVQQEGLNSVVALSDSRFVVAYSSSNGSSRIGDVSGTTISFGSEYVFNPATNGYISAAALSDSKLVVTYTDGGNSGRGKAIIGDVSGGNITYGAAYVFNPASTSYTSATALSDTKFVVTYKDDGNSNYGTAVIGDVSGNTITYSAEYVFNPASTSYISATALSDTKFVVTYKDEGNSNYGTANIGNVQLSGMLVGTAKESKTAGQAVPVIIGGVSDVHSGLIPGKVYYATGTGGLTTADTGYRVGLAISPTEILLNIDGGTWR